MRFESPDMRCESPDKSDSLEVPEREERGGRRGEGEGRERRGSDMKRERLETQKFMQFSCNIRSLLLSSFPPLSPLLTRLL